ncbi:hypothetical protein TNCV_2478181 [Trichonephila clavipes]|nr:hypothetical protein TNCV_2478181 [Trichonephila clavipes]
MTRNLKVILGLFHSHTSFTSKHLTSVAERSRSQKHGRHSQVRDSNPGAIEDPTVKGLMQDKSDQTPSLHAVVSDADCGAVGTGFESRRRHGVCKCIVPLRQGGTLNSRRAASPLVGLLEGEER